MSGCVLNRELVQIDVLFILGCREGGRGRRRRFCDGTTNNGARDHGDFIRIRVGLRRW